MVSVAASRNRQKIGKNAVVDPVESLRRKNRSKADVVVEPASPLR